jgi:mRNA (guanine-N7-)-methyltransferase
MKRLRKEEVVAILGKDKHGRFGILVPMGGEGQEDSSSEITAEDCAAFCYVGDVKEVMEFLTSRAAATAESAPSESASSGGLWKPPGADEDDDAAPASNFSAPWDTNQTEASESWEPNAADSSAPSWAVVDDGSGNKRSHDDMNGQDDDDDEDEGEKFHTDSGAAAADAFYSGLTRSLATRADSYLFHMRAFNGWVKATQIQELDPRIVVNGKPLGKKPLRVLDLACGKGGDLTKWTLHERGMSTYVGIDVARGSLKDAAIRTREMRKKNKIKKAIFTCADLGADVPGRKKSPKHKHMQKLMTWSLEDESEYETAPPEFKLVRGGGISEMDRFDVVSIQFAIHYMMSSRQRARRFFHTVSELLEIGGNLVCTTIDARVAVGHLMNLGLNLHFDEHTEPDFTEAVVEAGAGVCKLKFEPSLVKKLIGTTSDGSNAEEDLFGLQYTFTLVEGSDHSAGVGDAVNLPEWLTPIPVLEALGRESGLELEYAQNFHEFYEERKDPSANPPAHLALYNMKVLNREGSISKDEWSVSRMYAAIRFRKVRESSVSLEEEEEAEQDESEDEGEKESPPVELDPIKAKKMLPMAMMKAKRAAGEEKWKSLSSDEKKQLTQIELEKIAAK